MEVNRLENLKLYLLIYELKGMINTLSDFENYEENYQLPMIESLQDKMKEVIQEVEKVSA